MILEKTTNRKIEIFIIVTHVITKENKMYSVECQELGIYSQGKTVEEAQENIEDAVMLYLNTIEELGMRKSIFKEKNIKVYKYKSVPRKEKEDIYINPDSDESSFYKKVLLPITS